ncbi:MAG: preprotein translocase subunit SecY [Ruminococcus sp.]|uniref:Protein translocase subunit SecY n=1 Tax=Ruminococcus flavefaciens TaxID=1265 RepID=A0A1M7KUC9_RUMFL|nr:MULTISPECIES: preprotein translocase subunit SecY [Ruminococcus]MCR5601733.1 preprotein translocase subunit SecY [Ruminococcus sp.]SHM69098.1 protein translocase subunit secY/sec61 alpha [Ruminococcus flavefaciens]
MFQTLRKAWGVPEIRKKILYTLLMIILFRFGSAVTVPFLNPDVVKAWMETNAKDGGFLDYMNTITGGAMSQATVFSLSITPFINASIIMQLLTYALPPLERMRDEGEEGRKKIDKITAFVAMVLAVFMSYAYYLTLKRMTNVEDKKGNVIGNALKYMSGGQGVFAAFVIITCFVAGALIVVWMGNRVSDKGIGNGISILLFAGIAARFPTDAALLINLTKTSITNNQNGKYLWVTIAYYLFILAEIAFIVYMNEAERRIPIQYAKRVVGRKQYGGQKTHIPIKVIMSGVMPIIFAMSFMSLPSAIQIIKPNKHDGSFYSKFCDFFSTRSWSYAIIYFLLIIAFNYFYVSIQYNPVEIANNLRQSNGGIPGIRPGKPTSDYIQRVLNKISLVGAIFLGIIAVIPIFISMADESLKTLSMGGTTILIAVSVALETTRTLESHLMMRHHKGFLQ